MAAGGTAAYWDAEYGPWSLATVHCDGYRNRVTLIFDLLTSASMHVE